MQKNKKIIISIVVIVLLLCISGFLAGYISGKAAGAKEQQTKKQPIEVLSEDIMETEIQTNTENVSENIVAAEIETEEVAATEETQNWLMILKEFVAGLPMCIIDGASYGFTKDANVNCYVTEGLKGINGCFYYDTADLDWDGMEEIFTFWIKENAENGNDISIQVYEKGENGFELADEVTVLEGTMGSFCDGGDIRFLLKDNTYICIDSCLQTYLAADGMTIDMRMYRYNGHNFEEYITESLLGSSFDGTGAYHEETNQKLEALGMFKTAENIRLRDNFSFFAADMGVKSIAKIHIENSYVFSDNWEAQEAPVATCHWFVADGRDFVLPQSASEYVTEEELKGLDAKELRLARNEIYARYGWHFEDEELQAYFESKSWYISGGVYQVQEEHFSEIEIANRDLIRSMESEK